MLILFNRAQLIQYQPKKTYIISFRESTIPMDTFHADIAVHMYRYILQILNSCVLNLDLLKSLSCVNKFYDPSDDLFDYSMGS